MSLSRVNIVGAGPAGLLCAILLRRALPDTSVHVFEKNPRGATFGFGVVFSDQALDFLRTDDPDTHALLLSSVQRWQDMTLNHPGGQVTVDGVGFAAIGRLTLLEMLCKRATALGAELHFDTTIRSLSDLEGDLIVGADGLNSIVRKSAVERFKPSVEEFTNRFAWFGASVPFETLTQSFVNTPLGPFNAHHYRYAPDQSTFIVECQEPVFAAYGFDRMSETDSAHTCSTVFSEVLNGSRLVTNHSAWRRFPKLWCANWVSDRTVLLGDAAHTAHFSIGSGTRLAMEDAIALVN
ncbi:MAG: FAD-dependent monooxygenase, partial [Pseudomonadota bacterium]